MPKPGIGAAVFGFVAVFYLWTATTSGAPNWPAKKLPGYYDILARSFLAGRLSLVIEPAPELLALKDPYDPQQNAAYRLHDASLFRGKYYLYYGPTPALILFAPFRVLTGLDFPEPVAVALFCSAGLFFSLLFLYYLCHLYYPELPRWLLTVTILALGFGNAAPFLLRRPLHYEVAISAGYALVFASVYCFGSGGLQKVPNIRRLALGSLLLGLAAGARITLAVVGLVPIALAFYLYREQRKALLPRAAAALFGPLAICLFLLGVYNYERFGSWTEVGTSYILQGFSLKGYKFFSLERLPVGLYYYLLVPPKLTSIFPFLRLAPEAYRPPPPGYFLEPVAGLLFVSPLTAILVLILPAAGALWRWNRGLCLVVGSVLTTACALLATYSIFAATMRYEVDFASWFLIAALLLWFWSISASRIDWIRRLTTVAFVILIAPGAVLNAAISVTGYYDSLKTAHPETYGAIARVFRPLERLLQGHVAGPAAAPHPVPHPRLISPQPGSVLSFPSVTFQWTAVPNAQDYWIDVGTAPSTGNIISRSTGGLTSWTVDLRQYMKGSPIFVQLYSKTSGIDLVAGTGSHFQFETTLPLLNPDLIAPAAGTVLTGSPVTFRWKAVPGAQDYWIDVGTAPATGNIVSGFTGGATSRRVDLGRYLDGQLIFVQLFSKFPKTTLVAGTGNIFHFATSASPAKQR